VLQRSPRTLAAGRQTRRRSATRITFRLLRYPAETLSRARDTSDALIASSSAGLREFTNSLCVGREIMSTLRQKIPRLKLSLAEYQMLRNQVLKRNGWRCQLCGASKDLHVHHLKSPGNLGDDTMRYLIALSTKCHEALHRTIAFNRENRFE